MKAIPVFYENVKRTALVLRLKQPFIDWLHSIEPGGVLGIAPMEGDVYLLPDFEETGQMKKWLKKYFDEIFSDQLNNWYIDENLWPKNRTFKTFQEWFEYSLHTMVWDTEEQDIEKV